MKRTLVAMITFAEALTASAIAALCTKPSF
jgi:hypothetical protein